MEVPQLGSVSPRIGCDPQVGASLAERYTLGALIGEGASARVYRAVDTRTQSLVAIKVLTPSLRTDEISLERFRREIQITRLLGHPQIVSIYDLLTDGDRTCLVMEYLDGHDLKQLIRLRAPVPVDETLSILTQVLRILSVCHAKNVVHRDLKPQNVFLIRDAPELTIKLLDFGISRVTTLSDLTQTGTSLGSPEYMAPELFAGNVYDPRTDLYAAGIMTFELLAGRLPFNGDSLAVLCQQHLTQPAPALDVPDWLQHLVERLLAKRPFERYQSADEVLADIANRRVLARQLPELPRRQCPSCHQATLAEIPLCTLCGYDLHRALAPGGYDVRCAEGEDDARLDRYLQSVFKTRLPARKRGETLLLTGLDRLSANLIRRSAQRHGITLTVNRRVPIDRLKKSASLMVLSAGGTTVLVTAVMTAILGYSRSQVYGAIQVAGLSALWLVVLRTYRRQVIRPLFRDPGAIVAMARAEHAWLRALLRPPADSAAPNSRLLLSQFIDKYFLLLHADALPGSELRGDLIGILRSLAQTADLLAAIEPVLAGPTRPQLAAEYGDLGERLAIEREPSRRGSLERARHAVAEKLRHFSDLEDRAAALTNRLIYLQYVFNTLLGRAVVLRAPLDAAALEVLEEAAAALRSDLAVSREVEAELARLR